MKKDQLPLLAGFDVDETSEPSTSKRTLKFAGTDNPRASRVLHALLLRPRKREEIDRFAGASNGPDLISELRKKRLNIPCHGIPGVDRDGRLVRIGVYSLDPSDRRAIETWLRKREKQGGRK